MSRPLLLYVLDSLEENDVGDQIATLLGRLSRSRFEPRVVALGPEGPLGARIREMKVTVHRLEVSGATGSILAVPRLRRLVVLLKGEILHAFQPWSGTVAQLAAPRAVRVFRTIDDPPGSRPTLGLRLGALLGRRAAARNGRFFVPRDGMQEGVRERFRVQEVGVVPPCLDITGIRERVQSHRREETRLRLGLSADHHAVVCLTDFTDRPLLDGILEGFAIARTERPGVRLLLVGSGPEEGAARWQAEELRLDDSVVFMGPSPEKWSLLSVCEGLVDAGSWPGWSRTSMEAMAAGLPVVRHVPETDGGTPPPDAISGPPLQFARRFLALVRDAGVRAELVRLSAERIRPHDVAVVAERWADMYGS